mmetsp:Transcript_7478/g.13745  ORF Transcript_7478/g.13745 Transcript_7478/m.13745 type:complete len:82 (-) Transcript_7478:1006-1251(-)
MKLDRERDERRPHWVAMEEYLSISSGVGDTAGGGLNVLSANDEEQVLTEQSESTQEDVVVVVVVVDGAENSQPYSCTTILQ